MSRFLVNNFSSIARTLNGIHVKHLQDNDYCVQISPRKILVHKVADIILFNKPMKGSKETSEGKRNTKISQREWCDS